MENSLLNDILADSFNLKTSKKPIWWKSTQIIDKRDSLTDLEASAREERTSWDAPFGLRHWWESFFCDPGLCNISTGWQNIKILSLTCQCQKACHTEGTTHPCTSAGPHSQPDSSLAHHHVQQQWLDPAACLRSRPHSPGHHTRSCVFTTTGRHIEPTQRMPCTWLWCKACTSKPSGHLD